jgi:broad specificity phosphatase PhoE
MAQPTIYCIRHGETDWNTVGRLQGSRDIPLNARGLEQATAAGLILRELFARARRPPADFAYVSSPMIRATVSMDRVRAGLELPVGGYARDDRLRELSYGEWEGLTMEETERRYPALFAMRKADKWNTPPPAGESYAVMARRVASWRAELAADTVAVGHGGTLRALMFLTGLAGPEEAADMRIEQGVVYVFAAGTMTRYG